MFMPDAVAHSHHKEMKAKHSSGWALRAGSMGCLAAANGHQRFAGSDYTGDGGAKGG